MNNTIKYWMTANTIFSLIAIAIFALRPSDPKTSNPITKYDLSSPRDSLIAIYDMKEAGDSLAYTQFNMISEHKRPHDWDKDFNIIYTEKIKDAELVFFEFTNKYGEKIKKIRAFREEDGNFYLTDHDVIFDLPAEDPRQIKALEFLK